MTPDKGVEIDRGTPGLGLCFGQTQHALSRKIVTAFPFLLTGAVIYSFSFENSGPRAHFLFVKLLAATESWLEATMAGLGYELVDVETSGAGLLRVFIDKPSGITVEDCARVSNHLTRAMVVEGIDYERLEVSSPGLDRPVKRFEDFSRFSGQEAKLRMRLVVDGQRRFEGVLRGIRDRNVLVEVEGRLMELPFEGIEKARLKPAL